MGDISMWFHSITVGKLKQYKNGQKDEKERDKITKINQDYSIFSSFPFCIE